MVESALPQAITTRYRILLEPSESGNLTSWHNFLKASRLFCIYYRAVRIGQLYNIAELHQDITVLDYILSRAGRIRQLYTITQLQQANIMHDSNFSRAVRIGQLRTTAKLQQAITILDCILSEPSESGNLAPQHNFDKPS